MRDLLGPVRQLGHVVRDLDAAIAYWTGVRRVGPFIRIRNSVLTDIRYDGLPTDVRISVAYSHLGSLQIELIQQHGSSPSPYQDFLAAGFEGLHHLAYWTESFAADRSRLIALGFRERYAGQPADAGSGFGYFSEPGTSPTMLELTAMTPHKGRIVEAIRQAAAAWDGRQTEHMFETSAAFFDSLGA